MKRIIILVLVIFILSYVGQAFSGRFYSFQTASFTEDLNLIWENLGFILLTNGAIYLLDMLRMILIGKALKLKFTFKDTFGAVSMNILFGWLSPMAILGAPAQAYYLFRRGYPLAESITIAAVRSFSIILASALTSITIYSFNWQGAVTNVALQEKVFQVLIFIFAYTLGLVVLAYVPLPVVKKWKGIEKVTSQIRLFLKEGKFWILPIILISLVVNFLLVSFIPWTTGRFYTELGPLISQSFLFLSYMLLMPTPGASGLAEIGAPMFFQGHIPLDKIISSVTVMRLSTVGVQVIVGLAFMLFIMKDSLTFSDLKKFQKET